MAVFPRTEVVSRRSVLGHCMVEGLGGGGGGCFSFQGTTGESFNLSSYTGTFYHTVIMAITICRVFNCCCSLMCEKSRNCCCTVPTMFSFFFYFFFVHV